MEKDREINTLIEGPFNVEGQAKIEELTRSPLVEHNPQDLLNYMPEGWPVRHFLFWAF